MKGYIKYIINLLEDELEDKKFSVIKFENFQDPEIYFEIAEYFKKKTMKNNIQLIAKLSFEKYNILVNRGKHKQLLEDMRNAEYVELEGHLTKWRNYFTLLDQNGIVFLFGTEAVEDKGGLKDYYTISPEIIEAKIKSNYFEILSLCNCNFLEKEPSTINNIYKEIFKYVEKDLMKMSTFFDDCSIIAKEDELVRHIFNNLFSIWNLPNIMTPYEAIGKDILNGKEIKILKEGNKLIRRIGYDNFPTKNVIKKYEKNIAKILEDSKSLEYNFERDFPCYDNFQDFTSDLFDYLKGFNISTTKEKLFKCNFEYIYRIIKGRIIGDKPNPENRKPKIVNGEPIIVFLKSILDTIDKSEKIKISDITDIALRIDIITIANINYDLEDASNDDLINKWNNICHFIGGFENILSEKLYRKDQNCISFKLFARNISDEDVFKKNMFGKLYNEKILKGVKGHAKNSKILFRCIISDENSGKSEFQEFNWNFNDEDNWFNAMDIFNNNRFREMIKNEKEFIPFIYSSDVDELISATNRIDFYNEMSECNFSIENFINDEVKNSKLSPSIRNFGKSFVEIIKNIDEDGLLMIINSENYLNFNKNYMSLLEKLESYVVNEEKKELVFKLNKSMMYLNNPNDGSPNIIGAIVPFFNPVMLEKIIARYTFIREGFIEVWDKMMRSNTNIKWEGKIDRINQLSNINFAHCLLLSDETNSFMKCSRSFGYYSIYGNLLKKNAISNSIQYTSYSNEEEIKNESNPTDRFITKVLHKYVETYPAKNDELNIAFFDPENYEDIINSIKGLMKKMSKSDVKEFKLNIYIYTSNYLLEGKEYIKYWINNKVKEKDKFKIRIFMNYFDFNSNNIKLDFESKVPKVDISFFTKIMQEDGITQEATNFNQSAIDKKFPIVYLPHITTELKKRKLVINQVQFEIEQKSTNLTLFCKNSNFEKKSYNIIMKRKLRNNMEEIIKLIHDNSNWVVIIDENIDVDIIGKTSDNVNIIGFSTGEGYFGEMNTTISTNETYKNDLKNFLLKRLKDRFEDWETNEINKSVENIINVLDKLDGAEILQAINPNDKSINEFLAFVLTSKFLNTTKFNEEFLIRKLISLDSYSHFFNKDFNKDGSQRRPDHLLIEVPFSNDNILNINLTIIECKMGSGIDASRISDAIEQVTNGANIISEIWNPNIDTIQKRFYFNQLFRLLSTNRRNEYNVKMRDEINDKILKINSGEFKINLKKEIFAFNIKNNVSNIISERFENDIRIIEFNQKEVKKLFLGEKVNICNDFDASITLKPDLTKYPEFKTKVVGKISNTAETSKIEYNGNIEKDMIDYSGLNSFVHKNSQNFDDEEMIIVKEKFSNMIKEFAVNKIRIYLIGIELGTDIARGTFELGTGVSIKDIEKYRKDMKLWLAVNSEPYIFIKDGTVKIDITRKNRKTIDFRYALENIDQKEYFNYKEKCYALLGVDIKGKPYLVDFSDSNTPHLLIAGQTGSGKSVLLASIITSLQLFYTPKDIEFYLVDPKMVELTVFEDSKYTAESVTEVEEALDLLKNLEVAMDERYRKFRSIKVKDITSYNRKVNENEQMKRIIMVFDEYASMIESSDESKKKMEQSIKHLSQKARAAGIHLIICTQSPKAEILTTTIRNNLTARVGLRVTDNTASRLILDKSGAENLLGKGDMWFSTPEIPNMVRLKSPFIENYEIEKFIELRKVEYGV